MDMSASSASAGATNDMEGWKPYLHTSLLSPFSNVPDSGEAFLFPTFRIYSRTTFLAACAFTFTLALVERWLTFLLDRVLSLNHSRSAETHTGTGWAAVRRNKAARAGTAGSHRTAGAGSVYIHLPATETLPQRLQKHTRRPSASAKLIARNAVFFAATLLRYVLMIIGMGMDWFMLLSVVSGLTLGHLLTDVHALKARGEREERGSEEVELLQHEFGVEVEEDEDEDGEKVRRREEGQRVGGGGAHRRSTSRQPDTVVTP
ncbi:conserved hypothetical protein [Sporisorium reilianum SRZ2]|uniref:Copper transport protein n=1 Tax=Sporisorium reilianum (strain SRZ2) TaxID=999809 RepID=E6ZP68_SPORE|nr:conserved hypothetical protein [Sporisorium reilianum SRZ2]